MTVCALVAASDFNGNDFRCRMAKGSFDYVLAVDGGLAHLQDVQCVPDAVIGDFDSLGYVPEGERVMRYPSHKDKSDLELAFDFVSSEGFDEAIVYGALGGRLDHTIANLQMCARFAEAGMALRLVGLDSIVRILVGPACMHLPQLAKGTVSVFSAVNVSRGVTEKGLEYPLVNAVLDNRTTLGLSNELVGKAASVSVEEGTLFVFYPVNAS